MASTGRAVWNGYRRKSPSPSRPGASRPLGAGRPTESTAVALLEFLFKTSYSGLPYNNAHRARAVAPWVCRSRRGGVQGRRRKGVAEAARVRSRPAWRNVSAGETRLFQPVPVPRLRRRQPGASSACIRSPIPLRIVRWRTCSSAMSGSSTARGRSPMRARSWSKANRIARVARGVRAIPTTGVTVIDAAGATTDARHDRGSTRISPGMISQASAQSSAWPTEEHILWCAHIAKRYLESRVHLLRRRGNREATPRRCHPQCHQFRQIPGPRYLAASQEITVPGGPRRRDAAAPAVPGIQLRRGGERAPRTSAGWCARSLKYGVDTIKLNLSGEYIAGIPAELSR